MAFYYESIDLDLRKNLTSLHYDQLKDDLYQHQVYDVINEKPSETYIENWRVILQDDCRNMCMYFHLKYCTNDVSEQLKSFPFEKVKNRFCHMVESYQEQSSILDSLLEQLVTSLANVVKLYVHLVVSRHIKEQHTVLELVPDLQMVADTIYILSKVRGVRHIIKYMPHEVRDLEPVVFMLQHASNANWETKYVLLLWLSVIVLVPFDLSSIDSNLFMGIHEEMKCEGLRGSILLCLVNLGLGYLRSSTRLRNIGALFLSKLLSRPDALASGVLGAAIEWSVVVVQKQEDDVTHAFFVTGILEMLVELMKSGQRNELRPYLVALVPLIGQRGRGNSLVNLLVTKLSQRVGLVYLRPRVVGWAYEKGSQNLGGDVKAIDYSRMVTNTKVTQQQEVQKGEALQKEVLDYFADVDQVALEAVIDNLLVGLTNKDTIVRWSAAKGIGRLCSRLDLEQADDVFTNLLETCFSPVQGDTAWHGGCLALGELCRRGLILENRLMQVVPIVCKALVFEQNQGGYSLGVNVRDSACYVAWSAARAYEPSTLLPYLPSLSQTLAIVMLFDREVNVRRAASSTFQEMVGRCPNVIPHGIQILSESDYFALALRHNAYLKVSPFVAGFAEYYAPLLDHLAFTKVQSQDREVRKLASKALGRLAQINIKYVLANRVIEGLMETVQSPIVNSKHGALFALGDLLVSLSGNVDSHWEDKDLKDSVFLRTLTQNERQLAKAGEHISKFKSRLNELLRVNNLPLLSSEILNRILAIPGMIDDQKLLRGKAGELLRVAVCRLIECISIARLEIAQEDYLRYLELIDDSLKNPFEETQLAAVRALGYLCGSYGERFYEGGVKYLGRLLKDLNSGNKLLLRTGIAQAMGSFSSNIIAALSEEVVGTLRKIGLSVKRSTPHTDISVDPDTRRYAIKSLGLCVSKLLSSSVVVSDALITRTIQCLLHSMQDYSMNKRGDVGLYIRENAIISMQQVLLAYASTGIYHTLDTTIVQQIVGSLLQQLMEKIDRVRLVAGSVLQELFKTVFPLLPSFPGQEIVAKVFSTPNLQQALQEDQGRVDQSFQQDIIAAEVKQLQQVLAHMRQSDLVYHWNLPHCSYRLIVPLLELKEFTYWLFKGLTQSVGGISESVQRYSQEELMQHVESSPSTLPLLLEASIKLMQNHPGDTRVLNPLYKTLSFLLSLEQETTIPYAPELFRLIRAETKGSEDIKKVNESVPVVIDLLAIAPQEEFAQDCIQCIQEFLSCDLPIVRKSTADKFYLFLMSYESEDLITTENNLNMQDYLLETDWLNNIFDRQLVKLQLEEFFIKQ